jgi:hypothetical protein
MTSTRTLLTMAALAAGLTISLLPRAAAEPVPKDYQVTISYRIDAYRNERVRQFFPMLRFFESLGFKEDPGPDDEAENPKVTRMTGTIPAANARKLLTDPHVRAILLVPTGAKLPEPKQPVRVQIELTSFVKPEHARVLSGAERTATPDQLADAVAALARQRVLEDQVRTVLAELGFREAVGYDNRDHTRLVGMVPAGRLDTLLDDLRKQPAAEKLGPPFRSAWPLRVVEVMAQVPFPMERPVPLLPPKGEEKIAPDLRAVLADEAQAAKPVRMEVILAYLPGVDDRDWPKRLLAAAPNLVIEGRLGELLTVTAPAKQALDLAALSIVSTVRLPRSGEPRLPPAPPGKADGREALRAAGLDKLHGLGRKGHGYRIAIVDGDFRGWKELAGKQLPAKTAYLDLTAERNRTLLPDPFPGDPKVQGHGTLMALAALLAAPEAELTLIRVDPAAPYQVQEVARYINGECFRTIGLEARRADLEDDNYALQSRREALLKERKELLALGVPLNPDLGSKPEKYGLDPKFDKPLIDRQLAYIKAKAEFDQQEREYNERERRYVQLWNDLNGLKGIHVVASALVWNEGHPVDGSGPLSRYFDDRPFGAALWFQAAGDTRGQSWSGLFRDVDGNGVMEFAAPGMPLGECRWSRELNFLAWQPWGKEQAADLPAGARVRIAIQWREAHDPEFAQYGEDPYRPSLANLHLVLLRQLDPSAAKQPADDLEVVAQSVSLPQRLDNQPACATYEQTLEFTVKEPGRYVLRVEGHIPAGIRPPEEPTLPAIQKSGELRPRIFIETLDGPGRAVFADYAPALGSLGMPGDAHKVITVGAANLGGRPEPSSVSGPPHNMELLAKPDALAYDVVGQGSQGTSEAAGFAAGLAASGLSAGASRCKFFEDVQVSRGGVLRVPRSWLEDRRAERSR